MLAANATSESHLRLNHARDIAAQCPESLYNEIALTGSSARGIATNSSDIEINFWVEVLPDLSLRREWIASLRVTNIIAHNEPRPDNSYWVNGIYKGIELEAGWQTFADLDLALNDLIAARTTDHKTLRLAELIVSAKPLRGTGILEKWQSKLQNYPSELSHKLIEAALTDWLSANWREHRLTENSITEDIHRVWRLIFALNCQWETNWKYAHHSLPSLHSYPQNIDQRMGEIQQSDIPIALDLMHALIADTLELIKTNIGESKLLTENQFFLTRQHNAD